MSNLITLHFIQYHTCCPESVLYFPLLLQQKYITTLKASLSGHTGDKFFMTTHKHLIYTSIIFVSQHEFT